MDEQLAPVRLSQLLKRLPVSALRGGEERGFVRALAVRCHHRVGLRYWFLPVIQRKL
jgi:hypothetical protein